jgi:hypothetical protein
MSTVMLRHWQVDIRPCCNATVLTCIIMISALWPIGSNLHASFTGISIQTSEVGTKFYSAQA